MRRILIGLALLSGISPATAASDELAVMESRLLAARAPSVLKDIAERSPVLSQKLANAGQLEPAARALRYAGVALMGLEQHVRALDRFDQSAAFCRKAHDDGCLGRALSNSSVALQGLDRMTEAVARMKAASDAFVAAGDAELAGTTRFNMANIQLVLGDPQGALAAYEEVERTYPTSNFELGLFTNKASALARLSRLDEAEAAAIRALRVAEKPSAREGYLADMRIVNMLTLAYVAARLGNRNAALGWFAKAEARSSGSDRDTFNIAIGCLQLHAAMRSLREAVPCAANVDKLRALEDEGTRSEALALAGEAFAAAGDPLRGFALQKAAYESVVAQRRADLLKATATATADVGLAERTAQVDQLRRAWEADRIVVERWRITVAGISGAAAALMIGAFFWFRRERKRDREATLLTERLRVARDLHDTALQGFAAVTMQLQGAARLAGSGNAGALSDRLDLLASDARASLAQVRDAVWKVRSPAAVSAGLSAAVESWLCSRRDTSASIVTAIEIADDALTPDQVEALLRVIQEAVANAVHHGKADMISIAARTIPTGICVEVVDDGVGFVPADTAALGGRWGLLGMRERIEALGGTLAVESSPSAGTTVRAIIPR